MTPFACCPATIDSVLESTIACLVPKRLLQPSATLANIAANLYNRAGEGENDGLEGGEEILFGSETRGTQTSAGAAALPGLKSLTTEGTQADMDHRNSSNRSSLRRFPSTTTSELAAATPLAIVDHHQRITMKAAFGKSENEYSKLVSKSSSKLLNTLWEKKRIPDEGWPDHSLELLLSWLACHDTNNRVDMNPVGAGEREGRVVCSYVQRLHCNLSHGIGRSGNLCEIQPKALGSSMLACLANEFALNALHDLGVTSCKSALVVPLCTGMALSLCMGSWRRMRPEARYVVWLRVDQKSCFKSIFHAGFEPIIVDPIREGDALVTDMETLNRILDQRSAEILCVLSTTSCFAPRSPDTLEAIAATCSFHGVPHLVNNAYGLQSEECIRRINDARACGRVDAFVQSLDKNFQIPVGGAIIGVCKQSAIQPIAKFYPGRASIVPSRDFVLTMLHQGRRGLVEAFEQQRRSFHRMKKKLHSFAMGIGECMYEVEDNLISLAMTLSSIPPDKQTLFGSILFSRGITGARVVSSTPEVTTIEDCDFVNFGSHTNDQHGGYLNVACGVGMTEMEMDELFSRISSAYAKFSKQQHTNGVGGMFVPRDGRGTSFDEEED